MTAIDQLSDAATLSAKVLVLSAIVLGLQIQTIRYSYSTVPIPYAIVFVPVVGVVASLWADEIRTTLSMLLGTVLLTGIGSVMVLSTPTFVRELNMAQQNALLIESIGESIAFTGVSGVLLGTGVVVGSILANEVSFDLNRRRSVAVGCAFLVVGGLLAGAVVLNVTATIHQNETDATIESIEQSADATVVTVSVENRLTDEMVVDSALVRFSEGIEPTTVTAHPERSVPSGEQTTIEIRASCSELSDAGLDDADRLDIAGHVEVRALNGYETRLSIAETTVDQPC